MQQEQAKLDQVFHDVQLNFENFHNITHHVDDVANVGVNMDKLSPVVVNTNSTPNSVPVVDDVEFSDTEDMLEGIRNVVDKVSIEDTCDELVDLELTSSGMTAPWFIGFGLPCFGANKCRNIQIYWQKGRVGRVQA